MSVRRFYVVTMQRTGRKPVAVYDSTRNEDRIAAYTAKAAAEARRREMVAMFPECQYAVVAYEVAP